MKTKELLKEIRKTPIFRQLVPQEAGIGWPIPLRKNDKVFITLPFFGYSVIAEKGKTDLFPPFATVTLTWSSKTFVEYVNLRFRNPWPEGKWEEQVGIFPHPAIAHLPVREYKDKRDELLSMYDEMFDMLSNNSPIHPDWSSKFSQLLRLLMEPSLEPYYRALSPKFFSRFLDITK